MRQFEIRIVNELCGVSDEMSPDTSLIASLKVAINSYECIIFPICDWRIRIF